MPLLTFIVVAAEVALLIKFAQTVGGLVVFGEVLLSAVFGLLILRTAGRSLLNPEKLIQLLIRPPSLRGIDAAGAALLGGLMLVLPGVLTDIGGIALVAWIVLRGGRSPQRPSSPDGSGTIDVEYEVKDPSPGDDAEPRT